MTERKDLRFRPAPRVERVNALLGEMNDLLRHIRIEYKEAYELGHSSIRSSDQPKTSGGGAGDPTGEQAYQKQGLRRSCSEANRELAKLYVRLLQVNNNLAAAIVATDRRPGEDDPLAEFPRIQTKAEREQTHQGRERQLRENSA